MARTMDAAGACRACGSELTVRVLDLGMQPTDDSLIDPERLEWPDEMKRLQLFVCTDCWLLQSPRRADAGPPGKDHGHGTQSSTMRSHMQTTASELVERLRLDRSSLVLDVSCGDGSLLRPFGDQGVRILGSELDRVAVAPGVPVMTEAFGPSTARAMTKERIQPDVVLVNHALSHLEDLGPTLESIEIVLAPGGTVVIDFHHSLRLLEGQFDVACHAHRSYFSLISLQRALGSYDLAVVEATRVETYGGSVRALIQRSDARSRVDPSVSDTEERERSARLDVLDGYRGLDDRARQVAGELVGFLEEAKARGESVVGYGASSRGITLFCYCEVGTELIAFTVDRAAAKQGRYLPGSRIPVLRPEAIESKRADHVLILPWPIADEIMAEVSAVRGWGGDFLVALPELRFT